MGKVLKTTLFVYAFVFALLYFVVVSWNVGLFTGNAINNVESFENPYLVKAVLTIVLILAFSFLLHLFGKKFHKKKVFEDEKIERYSPFGSIKI